jgi:benzoyl-CoA reductase/2-hydroxyglutaryl-CoA dehydratase subunit BcrC/BadD/HgdB
MWPPVPRLSGVLNVKASESDFDILHRAYAERRSLARGAEGRVGLIGTTIPLELVLAADRIPRVITADTSRPTPHADVFMEDIIPPETKALFESAATGELEMFDLVVLARPYAHLYYYLKEVHRLGRGPRFPTLHMFDQMHSQRDSVRAYNWACFQALAARLERLSGVEISEYRLRHAIARTNAIRDLQRRLLALRWRGALCGVDALTVLGASRFMPPDTYAAALEQYLAHLAPEPSLAARPRLLVVTSEPLSHTRLHAALEDAGALVVAEDDAWGSRAPGADVPLAGSAREAVFQKYWLDTASAGVYPAAAREAWLHEHALRAEVDAVAFYLPPSDHQLGWDYPRLNTWLTRAGKRSLLLRMDAATSEGFEAVRVHARRFLEDAA